MAVIVNMACGLANRMFQYAYYLYLEKLGYEAFVDFYTTARLDHERVAWEAIFPAAHFRQASAWAVFRTGGGGDMFSRLRRRCFRRSCSIRYMSSAFDASLPERISAPVYISGVFQNAEMVDAVSREVIEAYAFSPFTDSFNLSLMDGMQSSESVAIHVRKGADYMNGKFYAGTCPEEYYRKAVAFVCEKVENPKFYVFTDNPSWVKDNFSGFPYTLVEGNPVTGYGSHYDMQLMSLCRHNIISNSTYSWWGAFLNRNPEKIVIIPDVWFAPGSCREYHSGKVLCKGWIAL